jgi:O-succinylbenzoate synthase
VSFAFEAACLHAIAAGLGQSLSACLSQGAVSEIPVNALLTGGETCIAAQAQAARAVGYTAAKIKVGATDIDADVGRVRMARAILGDAVSLRADANRAWAWDAAVVFARSAGALLEYIEEPLDEPARLPEFTDATGLAYAVDETFQDWAVRQSPFDDSLPWNAIAEHAIATIWKPTLSHGINWRADFAARTGWPVQRLVYSAAFESGIGIATIAEYASAQALPRCPAGLDTYTRLAEDISSKPLRFEHGLLLLDAAAHRDAIDTQRLTLLLNAGQS